MIPGPINLKSCPHCDTYYSHPTLISGNTFGGTYWTDGKMEASSLPLYPDIIACTVCNEIFLLSEQPKIDERDRVTFNWRFLEIFRDNHPGWAEAHSLTLHKTSAQTYLRCINNEEVDEGNQYSEIELRMLAWERNNDQYRDAEHPKAIEWAPEHRSNAEAILSLLSDSYSSNIIIKAEIHRQLGSFEQSISMLEAVPADEETTLGKKILKLSKANNSTLQVVED